MTDSELLERAAKAAGIEVTWREPVECFCYASSPYYDAWNPLTDDGDALRLAVRLGISLDRTTNRCWAFAAGMAIKGVCEEFYGDDPYAATRRAIVRAAAMGEKA